jgi:hypothetical protein
VFTWKSGGQAQNGGPKSNGIPLQQQDGLTCGSDPNRLSRHLRWAPSALYVIMTTWKEGRRLLNDKLRTDSIDLNSFLETVFVSSPVRVEGTGAKRVSLLCPQLITGCSYHLVELRA